MPLTFIPKNKKKQRQKRFIIGSSIALSLIASVGYWYVFVAGVPQLDAPPIEEVRGLNFQVKTFYSEAMGQERRYGVVLPPGYEHHPTRRYPVIFLLHGGHGSETDYQKKAGIMAILQDLYKEKRLAPAIIITPDGNDNRGTSPFWDSDYFDGPNGKVATLIGSDLVKEVKKEFRTVSDPRYWAIGGLSSGAWGAFNIGLRHINTFHIIFGHTGYYLDKSGDQNSPQVIVETLPADQRKKLRIYLDAGKDDQKYLTAAQDFHNTLDRLEIYNEFNTFPGGHELAVGENNGWNYWRQHLKDSLSFVERQYKAAQEAKKPKHP